MKDSFTEFFSSLAPSFSRESWVLIGLSIIALLTVDPGLKQYFQNDPNIADVFWLAILFIAVPTLLSLIISIRKGSVSVGIQKFIVISGCLFYALVGGILGMVRLVTANESDSTFAVLELLTIILVLLQSAFLLFFTFQSHVTVYFEHLFSEHPTPIPFFALEIFLAVFTPWFAFNIMHYSWLSNLSLSLLVLLNLHKIIHSKHTY